MKIAGLPKSALSTVLGLNDVLVILRFGEKVRPSSFESAKKTSSAVMVPLGSWPSLLSYHAILIVPPETDMVEKKCWPVITSLTCRGVVQLTPPSVDLVNMTLELPLA